MSISELVYTTACHTDELMHCFLSSFPLQIAFSLLRKGKIKRIAFLLCLLLPVCPYMCVSFRVTARDVSCVFPSVLSLSLFIDLFLPFLRSFLCAFPSVCLSANPLSYTCLPSCLPPCFSACVIILCSSCSLLLRVH